MFDGFGLMLGKFSHEAQRDILRRRQDALDAKAEQARSDGRERLGKRLFLGMALTGLAAAFYFANELGGVSAFYAERKTPDPTLQAPPKSNAKWERQIKERRKQRDADLDEIMN